MMVYCSWKWFRVNSLIFFSISFISNIRWLCALYFQQLTYSKSPVSNTAGGANGIYWDPIRMQCNMSGEPPLCPLCCSLTPPALQTSDIRETLHIQTKPLNQLPSSQANRNHLNVTVALTVSGCSAKTTSTPSPRTVGPVSLSLQRAHGGLQPVCSCLNSFLKFTCIIHGSF